MYRAGCGDREHSHDHEIATMTRAGGKPKGHKETSVARIAADSGDPHRARSELEFLRALNAQLPVEAFDELSQIAPEKVSDWTMRRHIHCPCVLEAARSLAHLAQTWRDDGGGVIPENLRSFLRNFGESYRDPVPEIWLQELERLYRLPPVKPIARRAIASDNKLRQQDLTLQESAFPALKRLKRLLKKTPAQVIKEVKADARRARAQALERERDAFERPHPAAYRWHGISSGVSILCGELLDCDAGSVQKDPQGCRHSRSRRQADPRPRARCLSARALPIFRQASGHDRKGMQGRSSDG